jgi:hypothetical protein
MNTDGNVLHVIFYGTLTVPVFTDAKGKHVDFGYFMIVSEIRLNWLRKNTNKL